MQAILILAHKNIEQIIDLSMILSKKFVLFIHFDRKYKMPVEDKKKLEKMKNVHVYSEIDVNWGGFSIGEVELFLLKEAMKNQDITYFHIISGQDWPVKNIEEIYNFFENNDKIYMTYGLSKGVKKSGEPIILWQKYYFNYDKINLNRRSFIGKIYHRFLIVYQTLKRVNKFKDLNINLDIYQGANWIDLPRYAVEYCLEYLKQNNNYYLMLKTGFCSDEVLFQSILCNSIYRTKIENNNHRYIKWEKKYNNYPAILDEKDYKEIISGDYYFARKVDKDISNQLIDMLNEKNKKAKL